MAMWQALTMGHWPSFNVPFFPAIAAAAGYVSLRDSLLARGSDWAAAAAALSHQLAPRATLFRRDAGAVTDLESLKRLMRSNDFHHDPVRAPSHGSLSPAAVRALILPGRCSDCVTLTDGVRTHWP